MLLISLLILATVMGNISFSQWGLGAAKVYADDTLPTPEHSKTLEDNGDGTYTLKLSVTGSAKTETETPKANVIFIMDRSGSMNEGTGSGGYKTANYGDYGKIGDSYVDLYFRYNGSYYRCRDYNYDADTVYTRSGNDYTTYTGVRYNYDNNLERDDVAITAAQELASDLLSHNTASSPDTVEMAFVSFNDTASNGNSGNWTTSATTARTTISGYTGQNNTGTNWEDALIHAEALASAKKTAQPNEPMYIIFLTDGNPTRYINSRGNMAGSGYETDENIATCYDEAAPHELAMTNAGYEVYNIGCFGDVSRMENLTANANTATAEGHGTATYYAASDASALNAAFAEILAGITNSLSLADVKFVDGVTGMTSSTGVNGKPGNFKYTITANGETSEWTDAPEATVNANNEVVWDLSKDKNGNDLTIADGVTVECSFVVWPSQEALDLIADLNNKLITYNSLTAAQKAQIVEVTPGEAYALKTNTDSPTLTYSTIQTITDSTGTHTTKSDPTTIEIENPDPVALRSADLDLEKKWDDSLDPDQREEVGGKVTLKLFKDNAVYVDNIELGEDQDWKLEDFVSVAAGLMVSESSPAYDETKYNVVTYNGKKYCVLEDGHDFHFEEEDINDHYELTAYFYHPMLIDGVLHNVEVTKDASGKVTGVTDADEITTVSATNTIKGGVSITKKVVDESGEEVDSDDPFTIVMHMQNPDGSAYAYDYRIYYGEKNPHYNDPEEGTESPTAAEMATNLQRHRSGHFKGTASEISVTLYQGDELRFVNVDADTEYYVDEVETTGYELDGVTYQIRFGDDQTYKDFTDEQKVEKDGTTWYIMQGNSSAAAEVTNIFTYGELDITKTVECDDEEKAETAKEQEFEFTVRLYADDTKAKELTSSEYDYTVWENGAATSTTGSIKSGDTIKLKDGQTAKIEKLPEGAYYEVTEAAANGYSTTKTGDTGTIVKNEAKTAAFTNTYEYEEAYNPLTLTVNKVDANTGNKIDGAVFTLTKPDKTTQDYTAEDGTVTINFEEPGTFTLEETTAPTGYTKATGTWTIVVTKDGEPEVTYKEDKNVWEWLYDLIFDSVEKDPSDDYTYVNGTLTVKNPPETTEVEAQKVWEDNDDQDGRRPETVTLQLYKQVGDADPVAVTDTTKTVDEAGQWKATFSDLPAYEDGKEITYTIKEMNGNTAVEEGGALNDDYKASYSVDGLTVTNTHTPDTVNVSGEKDWEGDEEWSEDVRPASITVNLLADGEQVDSTTATADDNWAYSFTDLPKYKDGTEIEYTVTEEPVAGYTPTYEGTNIVNTYTPTPTTATIEVTKELTGREWKSGDSFEFKLEAVTDGAPTAENVTATSEHKTVSFDELTFTKPGTYEYTVTELEGNLGGVTYDTEPHTVTVTVTGDKQGNLSAAVSYGEEESLTITNTYAPAPVKVDPPVQKIIQNNDDLYNGGDFTFTIENTAAPDGVTAPMPANTTITNSAEYELEDKKGFYEFGEITFTEAGTYEYKVTESGTAPGVTNDPAGATGKTLTFTVTDPGDGQLVVSPTTDEVSLSFTNVYNASGEATIVVNKEIEGAAWPEGEELTFTISGGEGAPMPETTTATLDAVGSVSFGPIAYSLEDAGKSFEYTISEDGFGTGWTGSGDVTATVTVSDNGDGTLAAEVTYSPENATITNKYEAEGTAELKATKVLTGRDWLEGESFTFTLSGEGIESESVNVTKADPTADFAAIEYDQDDAGKTFIYTIAETSKLPGGVTSSGSVTATVVVTDNGDGTLSTEVSYTNEGNITNTYVAEGSIVLEAAKNLTGRDWLEGESYAFELIDDKTGEKQTKTVSSNTTVQFDAITYTLDDLGEHTYTITETGTLKPGLTKSADIKATVTVTDNGDGTLAAAVTYTNDDTIVNTYVPAPVKAQIEVSKTIDPYVAGCDTDFEFTLTPGEGAPGETQTKTITTENGEGKTSFDEIEYTEAGEYTYTVKETAGDTPGFTYDDKEYTVTVKVTDNQETGKLEAEVNYGPDKMDVNVINEFKEEATEVTLTVKKKIDDQSESAEDRTFTFELRDEAGEMVQSKDITTEDLEGSVDFDAIEFTKSGTYNFTLVEIEPTEGTEGWTYDTKEYPVVITISDNFETAVLENSVLIDGEESLELEITNIYKAAETDATLEVTKEVDDKSGSAYDTVFTFTLTPGEGAPGEAQTKSITGPGTVSFDKITYTKAGEFSYTIQETAGDAAGYTYDTAEHSVTVNVTDENAQLVADVKYDGSKTELTITNTYDPEDATAELEARKVVEDKSNSAPDETFTFELVGPDGKVVETVTGGAGKVSFETLTFDKVGTYEYKIHEVAGSTNGFTYDTADKTATVKVTDPGDGRLEAEVTYGGGEAVIKNVYEAKSVTLAFDLNKTVTGLPEGAKNSTFEFNLFNKDGKKVQTKSIKGEGTVTFDKITFKKAGTYSYTIQEVDLGEPGYTYDSTPYPVVVKVTDVDGILQAEVTYNEAEILVVNNPYEAEGCKVALELTKKVEVKGKGSAPATKFEFTLTGEDVEQTKTISGPGTVTFDEIAYDEAGTYTYTIQEKKGSAKNYTYDSKAYTVTVTVTDDGSGKLSAKVDYDGSETLTITNTYKVPEKEPDTGDHNNMNGYLTMMALAGAMFVAMAARRRMAR